MTHPLVSASHTLANKDAALRVAGPLDANLRKAETTYGVETRLDGLALTITGERAQEALQVLVEQGQAALKGPNASTPRRPTRGAATPRTQGQERLKYALDQRGLTLALGPAGTGKTRFAIDDAVDQLKSGQVDRIILARPAIEAGERLGFLPGDMKDKVDPYMRPLYDSLEYHYDAKALQSLIAERIIEIAPVAFMRGRTLQNAAIVIDEAQNLTLMQTKMMLTRIGEGSSMALVGDPDQVDLPTGTPSGLNDAVLRLTQVEGVHIVRLTEADCVRSALVGRILKAYGGQ